MNEMKKEMDEDDGQKRKTRLYFVVSTVRSRKVMARLMSKNEGGTGKGHGRRKVLADVEEGRVVLGKRLRRHNGSEEGETSEDSEGLHHVSVEGLGKTERNLCEEEEEGGSIGSRKLSLQVSCFARSSAKIHSLLPTP